MLTKEADRLSDPATVKKQERDDKWMALAEFGFKLAGSNSPYFLQAVGEAANATLPGMKADKKEREARRLDAIKMYAQAEGITNEMASKRVTAGMSYAKDKLEIKDKSIARVADLAKTNAQLENNLDQVNIQGKTARDVAEINKTATVDAAGKVVIAEQGALARTLAGLPDQATKNIDSRLASDKGYMDLKGKPVEQAAYRVKLIDAETNRLIIATYKAMGQEPPGTPPPAAAANTPKEGQKSTATNGKPIIYKNGRWEFVKG